MIKQESVERVLDTVDIKDVVEKSGVKLTRRGASWFGCCPFHSERTGSFCVTPGKGIFHCFGCGAGGDAVAYVMRKDNLDFPQAVEALAQRYGIPIEKEEKPLTKTEIESRKHREELLTALSTARDYYVESFKSSAPEAVAARAYAHGRWPEKFCEMVELGYAPKTRGLKHYCEERGIAVEWLVELGMLKEGEHGEMYEFFRDRLMIPIVSRANMVIGFTARDLSGRDDVAKYLNSKESPVYQKGLTMFGLRTAIAEAHSQNKFYLVEGAPDAMRLHSIDINNAVAPLGTAWTDAQLKALQRHATRVCFIPDADPPKGDRFGAGVLAVMKNGVRALKLGLEVSVRPIPEGSEKADPDTYITSKKVMEAMEETDFIEWYAARKLDGVTSPGERRDIVEEVAALVATQKDKLKKDSLIRELANITGDKTMWRNIVNRARYKIEEEKIEDKEDRVDELKKHGFFIKRGSYWSLSEEGEHIQWCNFTMKPLFHIKNLDNPRRLFEVKNQNGDTVIIEMKPEEMVSAGKFAQKLDAAGNFLWKSTAINLIKLRAYLYETTESAIEITQLGWQKQGFYAWGNGVYNNAWVPADEFGIVRLPQGNFYIPSASKLYADERAFFALERNFSHLGLGGLTLREFTTSLREVFGDNGPVAFCFFLASLFHDVVYATQKHFPILNVFGQKGSGKTLFCQCIMSFFLNRPEATNITNSTVPALAGVVGQSANAIVHIDEYRNDLIVDKVEFIKGLWDCVGRSRLNIDRDRRRETTAVESGIMLSGQQMPTSDIAMFSRMIFLKFNKVVFTAEETERLKQFKARYELGCSHLTTEILKFRKRFEAGWKEALDSTAHDFRDLVASDVETRISDNWIEALAAFRCLEAVLDTPYSYSELLRIFVAGAEAQNCEVSQTNELADFWTYVAFLKQDGKLIEGADYKIQHVKRIRRKGMSTLELHGSTPILFLRLERIQQLFAQANRGEGKVMGATQKYYLEHATYYYGKTYKKMDDTLGGVPIVKTESDAFGSRRTKQTTTALVRCFDYNRLRDVYDISLESSLVDESDPDDDCD